MKDVVIALVLAYMILLICRCWDKIFSSENLVKMLIGTVILGLFDWQ